MKKNIVKDVLFLGQKSEEATPEDRTLALDLQDTLNAHLLECVGLAANMIGVKKRAIIIRMGSENLVLFNPVLLEKKKPYQTEEGCLSLMGCRPTPHQGQASFLCLVRLFLFKENRIKQDQIFTSHSNDNRPFFHPDHISR